MKAFYKVPEIENGFNIESCEQGWFSVVIPEASINYEKDPSMVSKTLAVKSAGTETIQYSVVRRGYSAMLVQSCPTGGFWYSSPGAYFTGWWTFSMDVRSVSPNVGVQAKYMDLYMAYVGAPLLPISRIERYYINENWQRISVSHYFSAPYSTGFMYAVFKADGDYYIDGVQLENSPYPTTYFDGDSEGFLAGESAYYWNGIPNNSTSTRIAQTASGGHEVKLSDLGFTLMGVLGLGEYSYTNANTPISTGGSFYQKSIPQNRTFTLAGSLMAEDLQSLERVRSQLIQALNPRRTYPAQPVMLKYYRKDGSKVFEIPCVYESGLEGAIDNHFQERIALAFTQHTTYISEEGNEAALIDTSYTTLAGATNFAIRSRDGTWTVPYTSISGTVYCVTRCENGTIYIGGDFTAINGNAHYQRIAKYTESGGWAAIVGTTGYGISNGAVYAIEPFYVEDNANTPAIGKRERILVAGTFTNVDSIGDADYLALYDGVELKWREIRPAFAGPNATTRAICITENQVAYVGGDFTSLCGTAANRVAKIDLTGYAYATGLTASAIGAGLNGVCRTITRANGGLYLGGDFTTAGTAGTVNRITFLEDSGKYYALGTGVDNSVLDSTIGLDSTLYICGKFTTASGIAANCVAAWSGTGWSGISEGVIGWYGAATPQVVCCATDPITGEIYFGGEYPSTMYIGGHPSKNHVYIYNGSGWYPLDAMFDLTSIQQSIFIDTYGLLIGNDALNPATFSNQNIIVNNGNDITYPSMMFYVSQAATKGLFHELKNWNNGTAVRFSALDTFYTQSVNLDTMPLKVVKTNTFINKSISVNDYIIPGAIPMCLEKGANKINVFATNTLGAAGVYFAVMKWRNNYHSIDEAVL